MRRGDGGSDAGRPASPLEMTPDAMRELGRRAVDALVERWSGLADDAAWVGGGPDAMEALFMEDAPEEGRDPGEVLERALRDVLPVTGRADHPRFFAFVPSSPTWPSVVADFLAAGYNVFQGTWLESAGPSGVENVVLEWFRRWLGLPEGASGILTSGGSAANLCALVTARESADNPPRAAVYLSEEGHSSLERAARIAGIRPEGIRRVPVDDAWRLDLDALKALVAEDRERGLEPFCVCVSGGATSTGAVDPLEGAADLCRDAGLWLHVDAAYGGFAALLPEGREALRGIERADSVTVDPHKWLFQPFEVGGLLVRDPALLEDAFRVLPAYLQDTETAAREVNYADRGLQLTRSFRALKIWMSIQTFGVAAFRREIARGLELAREAEARVRDSPVLELLTPAALGVVCYRFRPPDAELDEAALERLNARIQARVVESGRAMVSSTRLGTTYALRLCILSYRSREADVRETLELVEALGRETAGP